MSSLCFFTDDVCLSIMQACLSLPTFAWCYVCINLLVCSEFLAALTTSIGVEIVRNGTSVCAVQGHKTVGMSPETMSGY